MIRNVRNTGRVKTPTLLQFEAVECGAVALGIVLRYYECYVPIEELRVTCGVSRNGSNALNIVKAAQHYGLHASGVRRSTLDSLKNLPLPLILYWNFNHFVVFEGADQQHVYINDPDTGPRTVTHQEFNQAFTGLVLICKPGPAFQKRGQPFNVVGALQARLRGSERSLLYLIVISLLLLMPGFAMPAFLRIFIDDILGKQQSLLNLLLIGMGTAFVGKAVLTWAQQAFLLRMENQMALETSSAFFWHLLQLPITFFSQRLSGDLVARVQLNQRLAELLTGELATAAINAVLIAFYGLLMLQYDIPLTLISVMFVSLNLVALRYVSRRRRNANYRLLQEQGKLTGLAMNGLQSVESLKAAGMETEFFAQWAGLQAKAVNAEQELSYLSNLVLATPFLLTLLDTAVILVIGGERIIAGQLSAGMLIAFQSLALSFMQPFSQITGLGSKLQEVEGSLSRLSDVLEYPAENIALDEPESVNPAELFGGLIVNNLTFGYNPLERPLIEGISLNLQPGQQIALLGASGSGKSTIAKLIIGLYQPWNGDILFDELPRNTIPRKMLDKSLAIVDQTIILFSGTIWDNLTLWDSSIPAEKVIAAAKDACIHDVIMQCGGYDSLLEENGANFSGGERQRLELARALVHEPALLILDEATSALDNLVERRVIGNIRRRGCACLMITHRPSAIQHAEEIIILGAGQIMWRGSYDQFIRQKSLEAERLYSLAHEKREPIDRFRTLLTRPITPEEIENAGKGQPLSRVFPLILQSMRIRVEPDLVMPSNERNALPVGQFAQHFGLRWRKVKLTEQWWRTGYGPLLGYWRENNQPVALLPNRVGRYVIADPAQGQTLPLNAMLASRLQDTGYSFYKPLPTHALSAVDLITYGIQTIWRELIQSFGLIVMVALLSIVTPLITGLIFDRVIPSGRRDSLFIVGGVLFFGAVAAALMNLMSALMVVRIEGKLDSTVQAGIWDRLLRLPAAFFRLYSVGDLAGRTMGISQMRTALSEVGSFLLVGVLFAVFNLLLLLAYDRMLAILALGIFLVYLLLIVVLGQRSIKFQRHALDLEGDQRGFALQVLDGIAKLRVAGVLPRAFTLWNDRFIRQQAAAYQAQSARNMVTTLLAIYPIAATAFLFLLTADRSNISTGQFLIIYAAFVQLLFATLQVGNAFTRIQSAVPIWDRLQPILQARTEVNEQNLMPAILQGYIGLDHVSFRYRRDSACILDDLSLEIYPGDYVAIVSASGTGKSTLLRLLLGFEKPERGEIYFDKYAFSTLDVESVRCQIGAVLQNSRLIAGDIFTNIVGARNLTMADAWQAATWAGIDQEIKQMPMGMRTYVAEGEANLSGGQVQRLLIARALAAKPKIVFFDEATSSLDEASQAIVMDSLARMDATRIVIAHRLSTVMSAERFLLLRNGRLEELNSYKEIIDLTMMG